MAVRHTRSTPAPRAFMSQAPRPKVLILDDSPTVLAQCSELLKGGFEVHTTEHWVEANALMHSLKPDALVIDWNLAGFEGTYLIRAFRRFFGPDLPIVMLSGEDGADTAATEAGASTFVPKRELPTLGPVLTQLVAKRRGGER